MPNIIKISRRLTADLDGSFFKKIANNWDYEYAFVRPKWILRQDGIPEEINIHFSKYPNRAFIINKKTINTIEQHISQIIEIDIIFKRKNNRDTLAISIEDGNFLCALVRSDVSIPILSDI